MHETFQRFSDRVSLPRATHSTGIGRHAVLAEEEHCSTFLPEATGRESYPQCLGRRCQAHAGHTGATRAMRVAEARRCKVLQRKEWQPPMPA